MDVLANLEQLTSSRKGQDAEKLALQYLQSRGLTLIVKNFACKAGEIDLIMQQDKVIVFVEVRYRKNSNYGSGAETVDFRKQQKLINSAEYFLQTHRKYNQLAARIDVVSIGHSSTGTEPRIDWIQNAVHN